MAPASATESLPNPGVSVVIPAYNYAHYLPQAIDSVLKQGYSPCEIIVVDDGSTDNTAVVAAQYGQRIRYIHQTNAGLSAARNTGIRMARYDYVAFLDADDQWLPGRLKCAMQSFAQLSAEFVLVACRACHINAAAEVIHMKRLYLQRDEEVTARDILFRARFCPSAVVTKRAIFDQCGYFDTTLRSSEDRDMWIRMAAHGRIFVRHDRLVLVRRHAHSMSNHTDRMKANTRKVIAKAYHHRLVPRHCLCFWLRVLSFHYFQTAWMYHSEGRHCAAARDLIVSLMHWPWFLRPGEFNEPFFFRIRALLRFLHAREATNTLGAAEGARVAAGPSTTDH
jgi:glycosyltransferase involved in cell wall biosynthesis